MTWRYHSTLVALVLLSCGGKDADRNQGGAVLASSGSDGGMGADSGADAGECLPGCSRTGDVYLLAAGGTCTIPNGSYEACFPGANVPACGSDQLVACLARPVDGGVMLWVIGSTPITVVSLPEGFWGCDKDEAAAVENPCP
jgi:hypothetical protein